MKKKIAIYPGSFDPPHYGHIKVAKEVTALPGIEKTYVIPSVRNPFKDKSGDFYERFDNCVTAFAPYSGIVVSDIEQIMATAMSVDSIRTIDLLDFINDELNHGETEYVLVIGSDNLNDFRKWKDYERIINEFGLIVIKRPGVKYDDSLIKEYPNKIQLIEIEDMPVISSTDIRKILGNGSASVTTLEKYMPTEVAVRLVY